VIGYVKLPTHQISYVHCTMFTTSHIAYSQHVSRPTLTYLMSVDMNAQHGNVCFVLYLYFVIFYCFYTYTNYLIIACSRIRVRKYLRPMASDQFKNKVNKTMHYLQTTVKSSLCTSLVDGVVVQSSVRQILSPIARVQKTDVQCHLVV